MNIIYLIFNKTNTIKIMQCSFIIRIKDVYLNGFETDTFHFFGLTNGTKTQREYKIKL